MRPIIYQTFPRTFSADSTTCTPYGTIEENGCGKLNDYTAKTLKQIRSLGCTHIWYTGILRHATLTDYSAYGIPTQHPQVVKGRAGSPYAICDYYDTDPDLAVDIPGRMKEFDALVSRTHRAGLKMIIDFVPNHVARQYHSVTKPVGIRDLGADDDTTIGFTLHNNFYYLPGQSFIAPTTGIAANIVGESSFGEPYHESPARATGNDCFSPTPSANDWYETIKLNYGIDCQNGGNPQDTPGLGSHGSPIPSTWHKMLDIMRFWATRGVDGFRCDMAEMVPCAFWTWAIAQIKSEHPGIIFIAEVYNPDLYRRFIHDAHFDYLYDKVGLYDTLRRIIGGGSASTLTPCWQATDDIASHMLAFLENHDEQRIASQYLANDPRRALPAMLVAALMHRGPVMIYQGQALGEPGMDSEGFSGQDGRSTIFDYWTIDTLRRWRNGGKYTTTQLTANERSLLAYYSKLLNLVNSHKALYDGRMFDLMYANYDNPQMDTNHQFAFLRRADGELILVVTNFEDKSVDTAVNIPAHAFSYLNITQGPAFATDLLTDTTQTIDLLPDTAIPLTIPPLGGIVLRMEVK